MWKQSKGLLQLTFIINETCSDSLVRLSSGPELDWINLRSAGVSLSAGVVDVSGAKTKPGGGL